MIELRAILDKYTVQDGKELAVIIKCDHNGENLLKLAGIGAGQPIEIKSVQEELPLDA